MSSLYILNETFTNGLYYDILNIIAMVSVISGVLVVISKNPIVSVLFLIGLFLNIAGYLMVLGLNFIGLSYLLVYVGAVSILFLFILMLINVRISELVTDNNNSIPLAIIIGIFFNTALYNILPSNYNFSTETYDLNLHNNNISYVFSNFIHSYNNDNLSFVTSQTWDGALAEVSHITSIGNIIYTAYPM